MKTNLITTEIIQQNLTADKFTLSDGNGLILMKATANAAPTFICRFRIDGKIKTKTIGYFPQLSLADARIQRDIVKKQFQNKQPTSTAPADENAVAVLEKYLNSIKRSSKNTQKSKLAAEFVLNTYIKPFLVDKKINEIKASDIKKILDNLTSGNKYGQAEQVLMRLKGFFRFAIINNDITTNPTTAFTKSTIYKDFTPTTSKTGGRVLITNTDALTAEAQQEADDWLNFFRCFTHEPLTRNNVILLRTMLLLMLLCVRKNELTQATWSEFDFENNIWHLPAERTKTRKAIDIPLSPFVIKFFDEIKHYQKNLDTDFVIPKLKKSKLPHISDATLWRCIQRICEKYNLKKFSPHSYRKTSRSLLARLGVSNEIAERCLNHAVGGEIEKTYNKYDYLPERRDALNKLSDYVANELKKADLYREN